MKTQDRQELPIGGLQKTTLIDYPGKIAATIFTIACPFRCLYCHNPSLVLPKQYAQAIPEQEILAFLEKRARQLEAICITGGEPTMHKSLESFMQKIKAMGYLIKLDTNGIFPDKLKVLLEKNIIDYIAMDIKGPLKKYHTITGIKNPKLISSIEKSIKLIMDAGAQKAIDYEFRTTIAKPLLEVRDFESIGKLIHGAPTYFLQNYKKPDEQVNMSVALEEFTDLELQDAKKIMQKHVGQAKIR